MYIYNINNIKIFTILKINILYYNKKKIYKNSNNQLSSHANFPIIFGFAGNTVLMLS